MKYYQYQDDHGPLGEATTYVEVDDGWTQRQITVNRNETHASNVKHPHWGMILADQQVDYDAWDEVKSINKNVFDAIWNAHLASRAAEWERVKQLYQVGKTAGGLIVIFYPQGVIVELDEVGLGVADYQAFENSARVKELGINHEVAALVSGYDEENQWVTLAAPKVSSIRRPTRI